MESVTKPLKRNLTSRLKRVTKQAVFVPQVSTLSTVAENEYRVKFDYNVPVEGTLACWYCTRWIKGKPFGLPVEKRKQSLFRSFNVVPNVNIFRFNNEGAEGFSLEGAFCSPQCVLAFIEEGQLREERVLFHRMFSERQGSVVKRAPPRMMLKKFGGPWSEEEYERALEGDREFDMFRETDIPLVNVVCIS